MTMWSLVFTKKLKLVAWLLKNVEAAHREEGRVITKIFSKQ